MLRRVEQELILSQPLWWSIYHIVCCWFLNNFTIIFFRNFTGTAIVASGLLNSNTLHSAIFTLSVCSSPEKNVSITVWSHVPVSNPWWVWLGLCRTVRRTDFVAVRRSLSMTSRAVPYRYTVCRPHLRTTEKNEWPRNIKRSHSYGNEIFHIWIFPFYCQK